MRDRYPLFANIDRRRFLTYAALAGGGLIGTGLAIKSCTSDPFTGTRLTVMSTTSLDRTIIDEFERQHPDIRIEMAAYNDQVLFTWMAAGNPPDVLEMSAATDIPFAVENGFASDLTAYIPQDQAAEQVLPIYNVTRWDGKTQGQGPFYGIVHSWSQDSMLWYNKTLFDQAGLPYPSETEPLSFVEVLERGKRIAKREGRGFSIFGYATGGVLYPPYTMLFQMLAQAGISPYQENSLNVTFRSPQARAIFQWYIDWGNAHVSPSPLDSLPPSVTSDLELFLNGKAGMIHAGYWFGRVLERDLGEKTSHIGLAPAPQWDTAKRVSTTFNANALCIPQNARHAKEAWKFIAFYTNQQSTQKRISQGRDLPIYQSQIQHMPQQTPFQQHVWKVQQQELPHLQLLSHPLKRGNLAAATIGQQLGNVMLKEQKMDDAIKNIEEFFNAKRP